LITSILLIACFSDKPWLLDDFPIGFWWGPPPHKNKLETWQSVADANFTFVGPRGWYSVKENKRMLDFCRQVGLKAIVVDERLRLRFDPKKGDSGIDGVLEDYENHPALYGYFLDDEPNYHSFARLGRIHARLRKRGSKHLHYINVFPCYASPKQLGTPTYDEYIKKYMKMVRPSVLSYDHYALKKKSDQPDYFENLSIIRKYALKNNVPAWNIIQAHDGGRVPTYDEMRWQVHTSLAYGIKGILYFTYWATAKGKAAIVDFEGKPTMQYNNVKRINREIKTIGKLLLTLDSIAVYHTGLIPTGCTTPPSDLAIQLPSNRPLVLGCFEDPKGVEYFMLVNRNHQQKQTVRVSVKAHVVGITEINTTTASESAKTLQGGGFKTLLSAGQGRMFRLKSQFDYPEPK